MKTKMNLNESYNGRKCEIKVLDEKNVTILCNMTFHRLSKFTNLSYANGYRLRLD